MDSIAYAIMPQSFLAVPVNVNNKGEGAIPSDQFKGAGAGSFVKGATCTKNPIQDKTMNCCCNC